MSQKRKMPTETAMGDIFPDVLARIIHEYAYGCKYCKDPSCHAVSSKELPLAKCTACQTTQGKCQATLVSPCMFCGTMECFACQASECFICRKAQCVECSDTVFRVCPCGICDYCTFLDECEECLKMCCDYCCSSDGLCMDCSDSI